MRYVKRLGIVILSGISFVLIYMLLKSLRFPLQFDLWRRKEYIISLFNHKVEIFTLIHFTLGFIFFIHGGVRLTEISEQVQVVRDEYISYMKKVPHRYLTKLMMFYFAASGFVTIVGVVYM